MNDLNLLDNLDLRFKAICRVEYTYQLDEQRSIDRSALCCSTQYKEDLARLVDWVNIIYRPNTTS